ncbi:MAG: hypothetical protein LWX56_10780 [Ignavibacteria bacterium]|nr:hypothetical protein [Ignavibacteria bacterium]
MVYSDRLQKFLVFWMLLIASQASDLVTWDATIIVTFLVFMYLFFRSGERINFEFSALIAVFLLINMVSIIVLGSQLEYSTLVGQTMRIIYPFFMIKILKGRFFELYEDVVYKLSLIGIPLFIIQVIYPSMYSSVLWGFNQSTDLRASVGIWNFYVFTVHTNLEYPRFAGFMWEPGAYGWVVSLAIMFNMVRTKFTYNKRLIVFIVLGILTFSTTFFICLLLLLLFYYLNRRSEVSPLVLPIALIGIAFLSYYIYDLPFMAEKIKYQYEYSEETLTSGMGGYKDSGRFMGFAIYMGDFLKYPLGHGINLAGRLTVYGAYIGGPNGLADFIVVWGIIGLVLLMTLPYRFFQVLLPGRTLITLVIPLAVFFLELFSNPVSRSPLFYSVMILGLLGYFQNVQAQFTTPDDEDPRNGL